MLVLGIIVVIVAIAGERVAASRWKRASRSRGAVDVALLTVLPYIAIVIGAVLIVGALVDN